MPGGSGVIVAVWYCTKYPPDNQSIPVMPGRCPGRHNPVTFGLDRGRPMPYLIAMTADEQKTTLPALKIGIAFLGFICLAILFYILREGMDLLIPFVIAVFIYIILNPLMSLLEKWRFPRWLVMVIAMAVTIIVVFLMSQVVYRGIASFTGGLAQYENRFGLIGQQLGELFGISPEVLSGSKSITEDPKISGFLGGTTVTDLIRTLLTSLNKLVSNSVLVFIFLLLILLGRNRLTNKLQAALGPSMSVTVSHIMGSIRLNVQKYLVIKTLVSFATAGLVMLSCWIFGLDFILVWGILAFFFNFIPSIGSIIATILPTMFAYVQFESGAAVFWLGMSILVVQFTVGNIVEPRLMGKSIDLSPLLIMFSLIFWGAIWGIIGMFLSVPITAIIKIIFENIRPLRPISILMGAEVKEETAATA